jgi:hypothetical protein
MQNVITATAQRSAFVRSKVSNRSNLLAGIDGRSATARRFRDLIADLSREYCGEGALSTAEFGLIRQAAAMTLQAELLQARIVRGEAVNADELIRLSSEARRIMTNLRKRTRPTRIPAPGFLHRDARGGLSTIAATERASQERA